MSFGAFWQSTTGRATVIPVAHQWLTLIAQCKDSFWSVDLFCCESILLRSYWVLVVMDIFTRRIIGFGAAREHIDGVTVCRMFNQAVAGQPRPKHLSTDHDPLFRFHRWLLSLYVWRPHCQGLFQTPMAA